MTIRARLDGIERDINDIEPILVDLDKMSARIRTLAPSDNTAIGEVSHEQLHELKALHEKIVERVEVIRRWNAHEDREFVDSMWLFATEWQRGRP